MDDPAGTLRAVYGEWQRGNYRAGLELYDPEMTLEVHNPIPDAGVYDRLEGLQNYMRRFLETWEDYEIRAVDIERHGDAVLVEVHHSGTAGGARVAMTYFTLWTFAGDRVIRVDVTQDPETALGH